MNQSHIKVSELNGTTNHKLMVDQLIIKCSLEKKLHLFQELWHCFDLVQVYISIRKEGKKYL